jgi:hypothetical protein
MVASMMITSAFGSSITMVTEFSVDMKSGRPVLKVATENRGNVPAHEVQFEIMVDDTVFSGPVAGTLDVGENTSTEESLADVLKIPGRYPVVIRTHYEDDSGYRFSALSAGYFDYESAIMPEILISGRSAEVPVDGKTHLEFMLRNESDAGQVIDLTLYIPNELSASHEHSSVELGPGQEMRVAYGLENYSALANSSYQVVLVGRYDSTGSHLGVTGATVVRVTGNDVTADRPRWAWFVLGGVLPGVLVFVWLANKKIAPKSG